LSPLEVACGLTILAGVAIALAPGAGLRKTRREIFVGGIFGIIAAIGGALGAVLSRKAYKLMAENGEHIDGANAAFQRILGGLLIGGLCLLVVKRREIFQAIRGRKGRQNQSSKEKFKKVWPWVFMNSLAGQTLGVSCMQLALEKLPTGVVLAIIAMTPIVVIPFAFIFEGERPNLRSLFGGAIGVAGVVLLTLSRH
jgi:drug/metabolite transporter (DMT)-like permease